MSETVTGYIDHVIFRNEDNGYTIRIHAGENDSLRNIRLLILTDFGGILWIM